MSAAPRVGQGGHGPGRPAVFLDKDGTLLLDVPYNVDVSRMQLAAGVATGLEKLARLQWPIIIVSNQSGVARGLFEEADLKPVERRLEALFAEHHAMFDDFLYCPHHPDGSIRPYATRCTCRKPSPGMLFAAAERHLIDLQASWMVGDILDDVEAGNRAGCSTILIDNGNETMWLPGTDRRPDVVVASFDQAVDVIVHAARQTNTNARRGQVWSDGESHLANLLDGSRLR